MTNRLASHLKSLPAGDQGFQESWLQQTGVIGLYLDILNSIGGYRWQLTARDLELGQLHRLASQDLALRLFDFSESDFPPAPPNRDWIRLATDEVEMLRLYQVAQERLQGLVDATICRERQAWFYGNVKSHSSIAEKICAY